MENNADLNSDVLHGIICYFSKSRKTRLPPEVTTQAKYHILDTLSACVSGSKLKPGRLVKQYARNLSGVEEAQVISLPMITSATNAAFINGVLAHADETDDSQEKTLVHPGCAIVPASLAVSEKVKADGKSFLKSVVIGYDIGCRIVQALGRDQLLRACHATPSIGGSFGAAAAAAFLLRLNEDRIRYTFSYTIQQASGVNSWMRDEGHVEKAFVFGGMPARNGVTAALLAHSGFTGVHDPLTGENNFFKAYSPESQPHLLVKGLGDYYEIMSTDIKKYPVGFPIAAPLEALLILLKKYDLKPQNIQSIEARLPELAAKTVNNRDMPDINLQHILAVTLIDGRITFASSHSFKRMDDVKVNEVKNRIKLIGDPDLTATKLMRQAVVEITTTDGAKLREHVVNVRGTVRNPMTGDDIKEKCRDLMIPVLGKERTVKLINMILNLEQVKDMRELRPLISKLK